MAYRSNGFLARDGILRLRAFKYPAAKDAGKRRTADDDVQRRFLLLLKSSRASLPLGYSFYDCDGVFDVSDSPRV